MVAVSSTERNGAHLTAAVLAVCGAAAAVIAAPGFTAFLHSLLSDSSRHPLPEGASCDYGVVLGYALHRNGSCTRPLQSRVEVGVDAFKQGTATHLIFSGAHPGSAPRGVSEANAMLAYAATLMQQQPVPLDRWLLEEGSTSTRTNAWFSLDVITQQQQQLQQQQQQASAELLHPEGGQAASLVEQDKQQQQDKQQHLRDKQQQQDQQQDQQQQQAVTLLIVTSPFHQLRSFYTFKRAAQQKGIPVQLYTAEAPFAGHCGYGHWLLDAAMDQLDFWRELAALGYYGLRGWL